MNEPPADPARERALVLRAQAGDEEAFAALVSAHSARVYGALRHFGLDQAESEEVAQEVFVRAWRGLPRFQAQARLSTWLYRIAFNEAQRRLARRPAAAALGRPGDEEAIAALPDVAAAGPPAQALDREFQDVLAEALDQLPADLRAAVVLRDIEGLSTEESAAVTGTRPAAFKSRLHRGRMRLRALLEPYLTLEAAA